MASLKLHYQPIKKYNPSIINKNECINEKILNYFIMHKEIVDKYDDDYSKTKLYNILKNYKKNTKNGKCFTSYLQIEGNIGRFYVQKFGLQFLKKEIRDSLCFNEHIDIDIVNCYPTLLYQFCEKNNWNTLYLKDYVLNRDEKIQELIKINPKQTYDNIKILINTIINGGEFDDVLLKKSWLQDFDNELSQIRDEIYNNYPQYSYLAKKKKISKQRQKGSTISYLLSDIENQCILALDEYLTNNGYDVQVLMFDGLHISKKKEINNDILIEGEEYIYKQTEMKIKLKIKEFSPIKIDEDELNNIDTNELKNDDFAAKKLCELIKDKLIVCCNELLIFNEDDGLWSNDNNVLMKYINKYKDQLVFKTMTLLGERTFDYGGNYKNIKNMKNFIPNYVKTDNSFWENNIFTSYHKLLFKDGIYDFDTNTFTKGFNPLIVFKDKINRNFNPNPKQEDIDYVEKVLFQDPFREGQETLSIFLKRAFAQALAGDYLLKLYYYLVGLKDCGKGVFAAALTSSCGDYVGTFDGNNLFYNKNTQDCAKKNSWLIDIAYKRLALASEPKAGEPMDSVLIKSICSGGDPIIGRKNHKDEIKFIIQATMFIFCNDVPPLVPLDEAIVGRSNVIELGCKFVDKVEFPSIQRKADSSIKIKFQNDNIKDAFLYVLLNAYQDSLKYGNSPPSCVINDKKEWVCNNGTTLKSILEENFEITNNENDYVCVKDISNYLNNHYKMKNLKMSEKKIGMEITQLTGFNSSVKNIGKKNMRIRKGIKNIDIDAENENDISEL